MQLKEFGQQSWCLKSLNSEICSVNILDQIFYFLPFFSFFLLFSVPRYTASSGMILETEKKMNRK